ncbi:hypothetical protein Q3C01_32210 [Bradyrhizobium sp. UFLA05-109]
MITEVKVLLDNLNFSKAAIVDDAYDDLPEVSSLNERAWARFFDDISDNEESLLRAAFGEAEYDQADPDALRRDPRFVTTAWQQRGQLGRAAGELFQDFERDRSSKRSVLEPLEALISNDLKLSCTMLGSKQDDAIGDAEIVFLDLFLGATEDEAAVERGIRRVREVIERRRTKPPLVFLMSASSRLDELAPKVRDEAELLGCQFRTIRKSELANGSTALERLYDLAVCYPDSQRLNHFVSEWASALKKSQESFLKTIRALDLPDYANTQALTLDAEGEPVGDYVIDLYDLFLHKVIEGQSGLIRAAKDLNNIKWDEYPPAQFMPSDSLMEMMDGALFYDEERTRIETEIAGDPQFVRFGDVFLSFAPPPIAAAVAPVGTPDSAKEQAGTVPPPAGGAEAVQGPPSPSRYVYMVISQSCDLVRGGADRVLLLRGVANPLSWRQHSNAFSKPRTPVMSVGDLRYVIDWDILSPETWLLNDLPNKLASEVTLIRRFRLPFASQLQQLFLGNLGRIGTLPAVPSRYPAALSIFLKTSEGKAKLVHQCPMHSGEAVCLVGRSKKELKEWLLLSAQARKNLRDIFADCKKSNPPKNAQKFLDAVDDPSFYRALTAGLEMRRNGVERPFKNKPFDFIKVSTKGETKEDDVMNNDVVLIIEVELE